MAKKDQQTPQPQIDAPSQLIHPVPTLDDVDFDNPEAIQKLKERIVREAYARATDPDPRISKTAASLKNVVDILIELEKDWNVKREITLQELTGKMNVLEVELDNLLAENAHMRAELAKRETNDDTN